MGTILCPYNVFNALRYIPCILLLTTASYRSNYFIYLPSYPSAAAAAITLEPSRYTPSCYLHLIEIQAPGLRTIFLQRSRIISVEMY